MLKTTQNYLVNKDKITGFVVKADIRPSELVIEVCPDKGLITDEILRYRPELTVVEINKYALAKLEERYKKENKNNIKFVFMDFLKYTMPNRKFKVVSNVPFMIAPELIRKITNNENLQAAYLICRKEYALKFIGLPHASENSLASLLLQLDFDFDIIQNLKRTDFEPEIRVDTISFSIIRKDCVYNGGEKEAFIDFISFIFSQSNKFLNESLLPIFSKGQVDKIFKDNKIAEGTKIKQLTLEAYMSLFETFKKHSQNKAKILGSYQKVLDARAKAKEF